MTALLERDAELAALAAATENAARGQGAVVLVTGEPGIGKTSLVRSFLTHLAPDTRTLVGACDDLLAPRTFGPLRDAVRWRGGPLATALGAGDRDAVFAAVIEELSHPRAVTVLVVEDVHWADDATLDLLHFVLRRIGTLRALVVLTYRDDELTPGHPLLPLLSAAAGPGLHRLPLRRLTPAAVASLAAESPRDARAVYAATGGNPFFVTETLATVGSDVPATVVDAVLARVRQLDATSRQALEQLSVVPTQVEHRLVESLVGGLDTLADAERRGMLRVTRQTVAFRHELARRAIEQSLPITRRVALNRRLVEALLASPDTDVSRVVHHAVEAGDVDVIVAHAPRAAREAARAGSHRQALAHFSAALRHEDRLPDVERAGVLEEFAWELYNAHRFREAAAAAQRAHDLWRQVGDAVALGRSLVTLSRHRWMCSETTAAHDAIEEACEILDGTTDVAGRAQAYTYRGAILSLRGDAAEAMTQLAHARALATQADAPGLVSLCLNYEGISTAQLGDEDGGVALLRESLRVATTAHEQDRLDPTRGFTGEHVARAYTNLASLLHALDRYDELAEMVQEALDYALDHGFTSHAYNLEVRRCALLIRNGRWDEAQATLGELYESIEEPGVLGRFLLPMYARLLARRGSPDAEEVLERALTYAELSTVRTAPADAAIALLEWAWLTNQPHRAARETARALAVLDPDRDRRQLGELLRYARRAGLHDDPPFESCPKRWAAGMRGEWLAAAAEWQRVGDDYERALELAESGDVAVTVEALAVLDRLGATAAAQLVRRRLRDLGARRVPRGPQPTTKANPAGLTDRQIDVLRLLAKGLTNPEIADELVVSVRTVDHHVAAVLGKLDVPSRRAAAQRAADLGITVPTQREDAVDGSLPERRST